MLLPLCSFLFFFNDTATTEIYTLSLHDALPIYDKTIGPFRRRGGLAIDQRHLRFAVHHLHAEPGLRAVLDGNTNLRSEEHTSELQSLAYLVCRLLLEKKKK